MSTRRFTFGIKHLILSIAALVVGIGILILNEVLGLISAPLFSTLSGCFVAIGVLEVYRHIRYHMDAHYKDQLDATYTDERYQFIQMKSWTWAAYIVVLAQVVGVFVAMWFENSQLAQYLSISSLSFVALYYITFIVMSKKY